MERVRIAPIVRFYDGATRIPGPSNAVQCRLAPSGSSTLEVSAEATDAHAPAAIGLEVQISDWSAEDYLIVPAALYRGNRFRSGASSYPCLLDRPEDWRADVPNTISDVPRLALAGPSQVQLRAGDTACPVVGISWQGQTLWIGWDATSELGEAGIEIEEDGLGTLWLRFLNPGVREGARYHSGPVWVPSTDQAATLDKPTRLQFRYWTGEGGVKSLLARYPRVRSEWALPYIAPPGESLQSAALRVAEKYNRVNWSERGYYAVGDRSVPYSDWQLGWVGGGISAYAMAQFGHVDRARRNLEFACGEGLSPSGLFWSLYEQGQWHGDMIDMPYGLDWHLVRRSGDGLYFLAMLAEQLGVAPSGLRQVADSLAEIWRKNGQFGQFVSDKTGEIRIGGTASGGIIPAGLLAASRLFPGTDWPKIAAESYLQMAREFLDQGYTSGGPGEAAQCPDSESAFALLESAGRLWEATGDEAWLVEADQAFALALTWVSAFDFPFSDDCELGRLGVRSRGSVWANVQNKHAAPGICTLGGGSLLRLPDAEERGYSAVFSEIAGFLPQVVSATSRPVYGMDDGCVCERVNTSDWEAPEVGVGEGFAASCWSEVAVMLADIDGRQGVQSTWAR